MSNKTISLKYQPASNTQSENNIPNSLQISNQSSIIEPNQSFSISLNSLKSSSTNTESAIFDFFLYNKLNSRSAYFNSLTQPSGLLESTGPVTVNTSNLNFQITLNAGYSLQDSSSAIYFHLSCSLCLGVYPLKIALLNPSSRVISSFVITHITVLPSSSASKLSINIDIPLLYPAMENTPNPEKYFSGTQIKYLIGELTAVDQYAGLPINLDISPEGYILLKHLSDKDGLKLQKLLTKTLKMPNVTPFSTTFGQVNLSQMAVSGLGQDICQQFTDGLNILDGISSNVQPIYSAPTGLSQSALNYLSKCGISGVVLGSKNLTTLSTPFGQTEPFNISNSTLTGLSDDPQLIKDTVTSSNPVQQANNLVGDLAQLYYDFPNSTFNRVVTLQLPQSSQIDPLFLTTLLSALKSNPALNTVSSVEAETYSIGVLYNPAIRSLTNPTVTTTSSPAINIARTILSGLNQIVPQGLSELNASSGLSVQQLFDVLESTNLTAALQYRWLNLIQQEVNFLKKQITLPSQQNITITSSTASIPITILRSNTNTSFNIKITLKDNGVEFKGGNTRTITLDKQQNTVYFNISPRSPGSSILTVTVQSPSGNFTLLQQTYTIHSSAISVLGLILTGLAALLLIWWWIKTFFKNKRLKIASKLH